MSRLPIRLRLTAAFALATVLVLAGAAAFVYVRLKDDLDESVDATLSARLAAVSSAGEAAAGAPAEPEEGLAQVVSRTGRVIDSAGGARGPVVTPAEATRAAEGGRLTFERRVAGVEDTARVLATGGSSGRAIVVGQSLEDRDETLSALLTSFGLGGPAAVLLASLLGYALASGALRPVEAMRRRAGEVSLAPDGPLLPLPAARDEVRRLAETLNQMISRLRDSYERERHFVADASHELRTPIAVVKTELEGVLRAGGHRPEVRAALEAALEDCEHLARLAEDLLVVARADEGGLPVRPERLDARELLGGVREQFAGRAAARGRSLVVQAPAGLAVHGDPLRLRQALGNLTDNALRHGAGTVSLAAAPGPDGGVELSVSDEGPGFAPEIAGRAFERFTRGSPARTRDGGTGLGLAIVRAVAEAHGGSARIHGAGAVRITLPAPQGNLSPEAYPRGQEQVDERETRR